VENENCGENLRGEIWGEGKPFRVSLSPFRVELIFSAPLGPAARTGFPGALSCENPKIKLFFCFMPVDKNNRNESKIIFISIEKRRILCYILLRTGHFEQASFQYGGCSAGKICSEGFACR
jgi:hypothetical protein